jgi:hypothetical protein
MISEKVSLDHFSRRMQVKTGEWEYWIEGYESGGKWLVIVFSFKALDAAFLLTVFSDRSRSRAGG